MEGEGYREQGAVAGEEMVLRLNGAKN